jgi:1-acylglycerone phosphate reductase
MSTFKRTVLITGCSGGGLGGAALAVAFHDAGLQVYATARNPSKMTKLASLGIETLTLNVLSDSSKAAMAMISNLMRLELDAFGITVVDLKTGVVQSNLIKNQKEVNQPSLPEGSIYEPAREVVDKALRQEDFADSGMPAEQWAKLIVQDLLRKKPPPVIWRGELALLARVATTLPSGMLNGTIKKITGLDVVEQIIQK